MTAGRNIVPLIAVPDPEDLGDAMRACTVGERAWVIAKIESGASNAECTRLAGYSASSEDVLKSTGYAIAHRQRVQDALLEMSRKLMRTEGPKSIKTLVEVRDNKQAEGKDRIKAAIELLNRAGMSAVSESHLTVTHELSETQMDQKILSLAKELGLDEATARKMLISPADMGRNADAIDAEFSEVVEPMSPEDQAVRDHENARRRELNAMSPEDREAAIAEGLCQRSEAAKRKFEKAQGHQTDLEEFLDIPDFIKELM